MFPLNAALAVVLLTGPGETSDDSLASARPAVLSLSLSWEIMDPREWRYVLDSEVSFPADVKLLRHRYADLADAPPLYDCMKFPDRSLINDMLAFNRAYRQHLDNRQALELANAGELREMLLETDRLYQVWDLVRDTRCDYYFVTVRRQALKKLKETIGDEAYYSGRLPPHVPVWQFRRIDP